MINPFKCPICGGSGKCIKGDPDYIECAICGGFCYSADVGKYMDPNRSFFGRDWYKYSAVIRELNVQYSETARSIYLHNSESIFPETVLPTDMNTIADSFPKKHNEMIDRILVTLERKLDPISNSVELNTQKDFPLFFAENTKRMKANVDILSRMKLINYQDIDNTHLTIYLTNKGHSRILVAKIS